MNCSTTFNLKHTSKSFHRVLSDVKEKKGIYNQYTKVLKNRKMYTVIHHIQRNA